MICKYTCVPVFIFNLLWYYSSRCKFSDIYVTIFIYQCMVKIKCDKDFFSHLDEKKNELIVVTLNQQWSRKTKLKKNVIVKYTVKQLMFADKQRCQCCIASPLVGVTVLLGSWYTKSIIPVVTIRIGASQKQRHSVKSYWSMHVFPDLQTDQVCHFWQVRNSYRKKCIILGQLYSMSRDFFSFQIHFQLVRGIVNRRI